MGIFPTATASGTWRQTMASEFSPTKCAEMIRGAFRPGGEDMRETVKGLFQYHAEYLRVTSHGDGNRPSQMNDGTTVYYSWQAATMARFFMGAHAMASDMHDPNEGERQMARAIWHETDFEKMWDEIESEEKGHAK
jgi:hypothetical protein